MLGTLPLRFLASYGGEREQFLATIGQVWQQHELIGNLVGREVRARYKQSVLGIAWSVITPLISSLLTTFLFSFVAGIHPGKTSSGQAVPYQMFAYVGAMFWGFFNACISSGADSMTGNLQLLTKVYFPREIFTLSAIANRIVDFAFSLVTFVVLAASTPARSTSSSPGRPCSCRWC